MAEGPAVPSFGARLAAAIAARGSLCLGIDPHPELLRDWGLTIDAEGLARFSDICVRAYCDGPAGFAVVKPQVAFYEAHGSAGFAVLERTIAELRASGVLVLADAKRGDIGSTMAAYAQAWVADGPLAADAVTASPYLGFGSLRPLLDLAADHGRGVFVLAATSNPEGASIQRALAGDRTVAQTVVDAAGEVNAALAAAGESTVPAGSVGVVVGATLTEVPDLRGLGGPVLVPGVGAQGGRIEDLPGLGGAGRGQLLPAVSREVLRAGPDPVAVRTAAERLRDRAAALL